MKKTRFTEAQIVAALKKQESGISVKEISREYGISEVTFYNLSAVRQAGSQNTVVWRHPMLDDSKTWKKKTPDSNACLQNSAWITPS
jgi:putative transposase